DSSITSRRLRLAMVISLQHKLDNAPRLMVNKISDKGVFASHHMRKAARLSIDVRRAVTFAIRCFGLHTILEDNDTPAAPIKASLRYADGS
ncbi:MAG: hypothetical protein ACKOBW_01900, partial [Planctomycetota bacterium]